MASMRDWLKGPDTAEGRVVVVHCKAGKGRSGTAACSYLISEENWAREDALARFTARRMRAGFGEGISIPSQQRWIRYVDWWSKHGKVHVERQIEVLELHVWGLRDGVKVGVEGFVDEGRVIKTFHTFSKDERTLMDDPPPQHQESTTNTDLIDEEKLPHENGTLSPASSVPSIKPSTELGASAALFRPTTPLILPTSDINIDFERRNKAAYGFTMVTSVAHVWFNAYFESQFSSTAPLPSKSDEIPPSTDPLPTSGVFSIAWEAMDGIRGSAKKGTRALDRLSIVWRAVPTPETGGSTQVIIQPQPGEPVPETGPADWRNAHDDSPGKNLGLRTESPARGGVSKASSVKSGTPPPPKENIDDSSDDEGLRAHGPDGEEHIPHPQMTSTSGQPPSVSVSEPLSFDGGDPPAAEGAMKPKVDLGLEKVNSPIPMRDIGLNKVVNAVDGMRGEGVRGMSDDDVIGMEDLPEPVEHWPGQVVKES